MASARAHIVVLMGLGKVLGTSLSVPLILAVAAPMIGFVGWIGYRWMEQPSIRLGRTVEVCSPGAVRLVCETSGRLRNLESKTIAQRGPAANDRFWWARG